MNYDPSTLKQNAQKFNDMSDDELRRTAEQASRFTGMPTGGIDPNMMKQMSQMMQGMDDQQIKGMADMAKNMGYNPMGGMPNPMGGMPNPYGNYQQPQTNTTTANIKDDTPFKNPEDKRKYDEVVDLKNKANALFKSNELSKASEKYYEVINTVRTTK